MSDTLINTFEKFINKDIIYAIIALFLAMYGPRLHPKLPEFINKLFNNNYFRFCVILLIAYLSNKNLQLSLIIAVGFCLILSLANSNDIIEKFNIDYNENNEKYGDYGIITNRENYLPHNEPDNLDTQVLRIVSDNNIQEENIVEEDINIPEKCNNQIYNQACINYCYSKAGFNDEFCHQKFPQPEINEIRETFEQDTKSEIDEEIEEEDNLNQEPEGELELEPEPEPELEIEEETEKYRNKERCGMENISYSYLDNNNSVLNAEEVNENFLNYFDKINNNVIKQINKYKNPLI